MNRRTFLKAGTGALVGANIFRPWSAWAQTTKSVVTEQDARAFVAAADFEGLSDYQGAFSLLGVPSFEPDATKNQSVVTGSAINSFMKGVTEERRMAITDSSLFAQLVAEKTVTNPSDIAAWYGVYLNALTHTGWVLQSRSFAQYDFTTQDVDVNEAVLTIASGLLGGTATAGYALIKATLDSLKKLEDNSPWITVFRRETEHQQTGRFQVSLVSENAASDFLVSLMAFQLDATQTVKQVLFFKTKSTDATLKHYSGDITINDRVLKAIGPDLTKKVEAFYRGYVMDISLGQPRQTVL